MGGRPELITLRDAVVRHLLDRASVDEVEAISIEAGRSMKRDGMTLEEILVILKGAVTLGVEHVDNPALAERAALLRAQMTPWLIKMYVFEAGDFTKTRNR